MQSRFLTHSTGLSPRPASSSRELPCVIFRSGIYRRPGNPPRLLPKETREGFLSQLLARIGAKTMDDGIHDFAFCRSQPIAVGIDAPGMSINQIPSTMGLKQCGSDRAVRPSFDSLGKERRMVTNEMECLRVVDELLQLHRGNWASLLEYVARDRNAIRHGISPPPSPEHGHDYRPVSGQ